MSQLYKEVIRSFSLGGDVGCLEVHAGETLNVLYEVDAGWTYARRSGYDAVDDESAESSTGWVPTSCFEPWSKGTWCVARTERSVQVSLGKGAMVAPAGEVIRCGDRCMVPVAWIGEMWLEVDEESVKDVSGATRTPMSRESANRLREALSSAVMQHGLCGKMGGECVRDSRMCEDLQMELLELRQKYVDAEESLRVAAQQQHAYNAPYGYGGSLSSGNPGAYQGAMLGDSFAHQHHLNSDMSHYWGTSDGSFAQGEYPTAPNGLSAVQGSFGQEVRSHGFDGREGDAELYTTVMLRNIPNKYTRGDLISQLSKGFAGDFDFLYLPIDFKHKCNMGYCFINFRTVEARTRFEEAFHEVPVSTCLPGLKSSKVAEVTKAEVQGHFKNVDRLQRSHIMKQLIAHPDWMPITLDEVGEIHVVAPHEPVSFSAKLKVKKKKVGPQ